MRVLKEHTDAPAAPKRGFAKAFRKYAPLVLGGVVLFSLGLFMGSGKLGLRGYGAVGSNSKLPSRLDYSSVDVIYNSIKNNYDGKLSEEDLLNGMKAGLAKATGDPYTEYFNSKDAEEFYSQLDGTFEGIGAELGKDDAGNITIVSPIKGYPAEKAGLKPKDIIAKVGDKVTTDFTIDDAVKLIRGKAGTEVELTIVRDGKPIELKIMREKISVPSVKTEVRDGIGIMTISRFSDDTAGLARAAATGFKNENVKGVVLDLRGNPGGLLDSAVSLSSLWLNNKVVLTERRDKVVIETYRSSGTAVLDGVPTVVLINEGSASASEITAGALRDNKAATLMGQKSYGKGSVQQPVNLKDGSMLKVTIARWFTPGGKNIDKEGITPDKKVGITDEDITAQRDPQLDAALESLK